MDEGDLETEKAATRLGVDQLGPCVGETLQSRTDVGHLVGHVMHAGTAPGEKAANGRVLAERGEQLDTTVADTDEGRVDTLLLHARPLLERAAEQPLVGLERLVEVLDRDADVVDTARLHAGDRMRKARRAAVETGVPGG